MAFSIEEIMEDIGVLARGAAIVGMPLPFIIIKAADMVGNPDELQSCGDRWVSEQVKGRIDYAKKMIDKYVHELEDSWEGDGKAAYEAYIAKLTESYTAMSASANQIGQALREASGVMRTAQVGVAVAIGAAAVAVGLGIAALIPSFGASSLEIIGAIGAAAAALVAILVPLVQCFNNLEALLNRFSDAANKLTIPTPKGQTRISVPQPGRDIGDWRPANG